MLQAAQALGRPHYSPPRGSWVGGLKISPFCGTVLLPQCRVYLRVRVVFRRVHIGVGLVFPHYSAVRVLGAHRARATGA